VAGGHFSKSARSGAPPVCSRFLKDTLPLYSQVDVAHPPTEPPRERDSFGPPVEVVQAPIQCRFLVLILPGLQVTVQDQGRVGHSTEK
jgi:hypothetical protein